MRQQRPSCERYPDRFGQPAAGETCIAIRAAAPVLALVTGGEGTTTTTGGAEVTTPGGTVRVDGSTTRTEPNRYLRCLNIVGGQGGALESPESVANRQERLCGHYRNQPQR